MKSKVQEEIIRTYEISNGCKIIARYGQSFIGIEDSREMVYVNIDEIKSLIETLQDIQNWIKEKK